MDAILLLRRQHKEVTSLFDEFENSKDHDAKQKLFEQIADLLAIHTAIEEKYFYPAARSKGTKEDLAEAYDEHKEVKSLLLHALKSTDHPGFDGIVAAIRGGLEHHLEEEENNLFPKVRKLLDRAELSEIGENLNKMTNELKQKGNARKDLKVAVKVPV